MAEHAAAEHATGTSTPVGDARQAKTGAVDAKSGQVAPAGSSGGKKKKKGKK